MKSSNYLVFARVTVSLIQKYFFWISAPFAWQAVSHRMKQKPQSIHYKVQLLKKRFWEMGTHTALSFLQKPLQKEGAREVVP